MARQRSTKYINVRRLSENVIKRDSGMVYRTKRNIFSSSHLAEIDECEKNEDGKYTGKATVKLLTTPGVRKNCIIPVPAGQSYWCGGMPPAGTLCLVSWLPMGIGIITAVYPYNLRGLVEKRDLQDLIPGEILLQSSTGELKAEQEPAGKMLFDRNGRITIESNEEDSDTTRIILGDPGNDNGLAELESDDEITGEQIALSLSVGDTEIDITTSGSVVIKSDKVFLGSGSDHKKLATEDFVEDVYNEHRHNGGTLTNSGGGLAGFSGTPTLEGSNSHMTDKTKAL